MNKKQLFEKILSLELPKDDFAVFGSGPLLANNLISQIEDIDIIAKEKAWEKAKKLGRTETSPSKKGRVVRLQKEGIEIHNSWTPGEWQVEELINEADTIGGIRFVNLRSVLKSKRLTSRKKDKKHIEILKNYIEGR